MGKSGEGIFNALRSAVRRCGKSEKNMTLETFIGQFDKPGCVVLLEGKRHVAEADREKLVTLGRSLAERTKHMIFRSGNAKGADEYFSRGVVSVDAECLQVVSPYKDHRKAYNQAGTIYSLDDIDLAEEPELIYESRQNKKTLKLIDRYVSGDRDPYAMKSAYIIRDTVKVLGSKEISRASAGIFYDDLQRPMAGGTGHTMKVCQRAGVLTLDQTVWFGWLS